MFDCLFGRSRYELLLGSTPTDTSPGFGSMFRGMLCGLVAGGAIGKALLVGGSAATFLWLLKTYGDVAAPNPCEATEGAELFLDAVVGNVTAMAGGGVPVNVSSVSVIGCVDGSPLAADAAVDLAVVGACTGDGYSVYAQPGHVTSLGDAATTLLKHTAVLAAKSATAVAQCTFGLSGEIAGRDVVAEGPLFGVNPP